MKRALPLIALFVSISACKSSNDASAPRAYACDRAAGDSQCPEAWHCGLEGYCYPLAASEGRPHRCEQGAGDCTEGWMCGLEDVCHDLDAGAYLCAVADAGLDDAFCPGGWRCGINGLCHSREPGAYPCNVSTDCESTWRCGPDGVCVDPSADALRDLPFVDPQFELFTRGLLDEPPAHLAAGTAIGPVGQIGQGSTVAWIASDQLTVLVHASPEYTQLPPTAVYRVPMAEASVASLAVGGNRVYVHQVSGEVTECIPGDGGLACASRGFVGHGLFRASASAAPLLAVLDGGTVTLFPTGAGVPITTTPPTPLRDLALISHGASQLLLLGVAADGMWGALRVGNSYSGLNGTSGPMPAWSHLAAFGGFTGCDAGSMPAPVSPERVGFAQLTQIFGQPAARIWVESEPRDGATGARTLAAFDLLNVTNTPPFSWCWNPVTPLFGPQTGKAACSGATRGFCPPSDGGDNRHTATFYSDGDAGPPMRMAVFCEDSAASGGPTERLTVINLATCFPISTSPLEGGVFSPATGRLATFTDPARLRLWEPIRTEAVPLSPDRVPRALVITDGGLKSYGQRFPHEEREGFGLVVSSTRVTPAEEVAGELVNDPRVVVLQGLATGLAVPAGSAFDAVAYVDQLATLPPPFEGAALRRSDGQTEWMLASEDALFTGTLAMSARIAPLPRVRVQSIAALPPDPDAGVQAAAWVVVGSRLFKVEAASDTQWRAAEIDVAPGELIRVWNDGDRARYGYRDGRVYALPSRLLLAEALQDAGQVAGYAQACGRTLAMTDKGRVVALEGPGPVGRWLDVPLPAGFDLQTLPVLESSGQLVFPRLRVLGDTVYILSRNGQIAASTGFSCDGGMP